VTSARFPGGSVGALAGACVLCLLAPVSARPDAPLAGPDDWPTYRADVQRSGIAGKALELPLHAQWVHVPCHPPQPAWPPPAARDVLHDIPKLSPTTIYDRAYHVAVVDDRVYYGSSADDAVYCLDADTGRVLWSYITGGPVRLAPTVTNGRVYAGSDDGCVYCLDALDGGIVWRQRIGPKDKRLPGNGRMISLWPVRSGVIVAGNEAYCAAGLFPSQGAYLCARNADTGEALWTRPVDASAQGYLLASSTQLYLPTGRTAPAAFLRRNGDSLGSFEGLGGCFGLVTDDMLARGPDERGDLRLDTPQRREKIVSTPGRELLAKGGVVYILKEDGLTALDRERYVEIGCEIEAIEAVKRSERTSEQKARQRELIEQRAACRKWSVPCETAYTMVMAGDLLFVGGQGHVTAHRADDGLVLWRGDAAGNVYGLAVAGGRLFASTDQGTIACFRHGAGSSAIPAPAQSAEPPFPEDKWTPLYEKAAKRCVDLAHGTKGYCLVLDAGIGRLAYSIARLSEFRVVGIEADAGKVAEARRRLSKAGVYGTRVAVHHADGAALPYPKYFANLVVCDASLISRQPPSTPAREVTPVLRPCGGVAVFAGPKAKALRPWGAGALPKWRVTRRRGVARRGPLEGAGEWTHTYADPGNTACSGDVLVGAPLELQWFGEPGPRRMVDRHFRNVPPLYKHGRLFVPGDGAVYAVDAYNGTLLWQVAVPNSLRVGVFLDSSNMVVDERRLYVVAEDRCHGFDVRTGAAAFTHALPSFEDEADLEWGYVARAGEQLLGSARQRGATYNVITKDAELNAQAVWYPNMRVAVSRRLFALKPEAGTTLWTYASGGRIIEATLTVGGGRLHFVETHSPKALADASGRLSLLDAATGGEQYLTALDLATGRPAYRREIDMGRLQQPVFMSYAHEVLLLSGSRIAGDKPIRKGGTASFTELAAGQAIHYAFYAFDAPTGTLLWDAGHQTDLEVRGGHGEYNRHPTIVGHTAYTWPYAYDLETGQRSPDWLFDRRGHGCGGVSASAHGLFWRGGNPWIYDLRPGKGAVRLTEVTRPGCWINIVPAGGLVLIPEASAGCTCGYSIQASLAFAPAQSWPADGSL